MNDNNMFSTVVGKKRELISMLDQARAAIKNGEIDPNDIVFETSPGAYNNGLVKDSELAFFGFSFKKGIRKKSASASNTSNEETVTMVVPKTDIPALPKVTDRQAEMFKIGINYRCDCGWETSSVTGFKKHFNKCQKRAKTWEDLKLNLSRRSS